MSIFQQELLDELEDLVTQGMGTMTIALSSGRRVLVSVHPVPLSLPRSRMDDLPLGVDD